MKIIGFVTSNQFKFDHAQHMLAEFNITLDRLEMDFIEIQSENGETITRHKAEQAYNHFQHPVVVNDDSWSIPALNGFPGPYMKSVNDWFSEQNWLDLTSPLTNRTIILQQHIVYQDAHGQHYFLQEITGQLMPEIHGSHKYSHLAITSFDGGKTSGAERVTAGKPAVDTTTATAWHTFGEWFTTYSNHHEAAPSPNL